MYVILKYTICVHMHIQADVLLMSEIHSVISHLKWRSLEHFDALQAYASAEVGLTIRIGKRESKVWH